MPLSLSRPLVTIIIPGIVATAPGLLLLLYYHPQLGSIYKEYTWPTNVCCFALVVVVGSLIESCMTYLERRWDGRVKEPDQNAAEDWVSQNWYDYLARRFGNTEPVGYRYLSRTVTAMYFELSMALAVPIALLSIGYLLVQIGDSGIAIVLFVGSPIALFVLVKSARDTHDLLCRVRQKINIRLDLPTGAARAQG